MAKSKKVEGQTIKYNGQEKKDENTNNVEDN